MMQNIEKVLDRGEKLELLVDKTENLRYQADQFQKSGKALRNKMWWQARFAWEWGWGEAGVVLRC
jgi:hypothetical protein